MVRYYNENYVVNEYGELTTNQPIVKLASKYGVSDSAYRKWLTKRGLPAKLKDIKLFISSV